jgi:PhnB protein
MPSDKRAPVVAPMLGVPDGPAAIEWYKKALGARELWRVGTGQVAGLEIDGAPFFLAEPANNGWNSPKEIGATTVRIELFCDDPDTVVTRAVQAGATNPSMEDHQRSWGLHRQGGFVDPFGHLWLVGDKSPLGGGEETPGSQG